MTTFNKSTTQVRQEAMTVNAAGGPAHTISDEMNLVMTMLTSFVEPQYYEGANAGLDRVRELAGTIDPAFSLKLAVYARQKFNMRTIPGVLVGEVIVQHPGTPGIRRAIRGVCQRPDDMANLIAYWCTRTKQRKGATKLPAALYHGLKLAFNNFNDYSLGKYQMKDKEWSLLDIINMVRPTPITKNAKSLKSLIETGGFKVETWETQLSASQGENKEKVWRDLVFERKLGYMALLRNLRSILHTKDIQTIEEACSQLVNNEAIAKSKQFPYRFWSAWKELQNEAGATEMVLPALSKAMNASAINVPPLPRTAILIDTSGSMRSSMSSKSKATPVEVAAILAASLGTQPGVGIIQFADRAAYIPHDPIGSIAGTCGLICNSIGQVGHGTDMGTGIAALRESYDRIIVLSDMQTWRKSGYGMRTDPEHELANYRKRHNCNPWVYSIDLCGYGTTQFHENGRVALLAGFSDRLYNIIGMLETDKKALQTDILATEF